MEFRPAYMLRMASSRPPVHCQVDLRHARSIRDLLVVAYCHHSGGARHCPAIAIQRFAPGCYGVEALDVERGIIG